MGFVYCFSSTASYPLGFDIKDTDPIIIEWRLGVLWLAGIEDGDDEHITVSLDMVTEHTTHSVRGGCGAHRSTHHSFCFHFKIWGLGLFKMEILITGNVFQLVIISSVTDEKIEFF